MLLLGILIVCLIAPVHSLGADPQTKTKAMIIHYTLSGDSLKVIDSRIIYGYPPNNLGHDELTVKILSRDNALVQQFGVDDPRILYYEGGAKVLDTVNFSIIMPFDPAMESVDVYDGTSGTIMAHAVVKNTVTSFCNDHREDKDCTGIISPLPPWTLLAGVVLFVAIIGVLGLLNFKRRNTGKSSDKNQ